MNKGIQRFLGWSAIGGALVVLGGCVAVPGGYVDGGYYEQPYYGYSEPGPVVVNPAPVYIDADVYSRPRYWRGPPGYYGRPGWDRDRRPGWGGRPGWSGSRPVPVPPVVAPRPAPSFPHGLRPAPGNPNVPGPFTLPPSERPGGG